MKLVNANMTVVEFDVVPLVAVTVTESDSILDELQARLVVEVVPKVKLFGVKPQVMLPDGVNAKVPDPVNPLILVTVMVEDPVVPAGTETVVGLASIPIAGAPATVIEILAVVLVMRLFVPPAAVIVAVNVVALVGVAENPQVVVVVPPAASAGEAGAQVIRSPAGEDV